MNYSVISISEDIVILESENGNISKHKISEFTGELKEGCIVQCDMSGFFFSDSEETESRRQTVHTKMKNLFKKKHN